MTKQRPTDASQAMTTRVDALLNFDADRTVRGIVFHLVDEKLARQVAEDSVQRTLARLTRRSARLIILKELWEVMSNADRLEWLLNESHTTFVRRPEGHVALEADQKK